MSYIAPGRYRPDLPAVSGVLLVNLGSPAAPTARALRPYLAEFLSDPRVVEMPRWLWRIILHGAILRIRPARSAKLYQSIWREAGSPLVTTTERQAQALARLFADQGIEQVAVSWAMRYGTPVIGERMRELAANHNLRELIVLPLYPQYSATTTASTLDAVNKELASWRGQPALQFINDYHDHPGYIDAVADRIDAHWRRHGRGDRLLFSFHGIPQRYADDGDPYPELCRASAIKIARRLKLRDDDWLLTFQSRVGREPWLQPYTGETLREFPGQGVRKIDVVCPGFATDCLETLQEIDIENRELFLEAGGEAFSYIPCLNDDPAHIEALASLLMPLRGIGSEE
ncbi:MAG: ferrochelatase [Pseudomonadota bacterium]|nr:ferrochelatase [Pseudomonadota bacterium]